MLREKSRSEISPLWNSGEDPRFPEGENTAEVLIRLQNFNEQLAQEATTKTLVITHNVVLRCLIGNAHAIPAKDWHSPVVGLSHLLRLYACSYRYSR